MDNVAQVLGVTGGLIAILGAIVGVLLFVRGSYNKARLQALREDNDDLRKRVDDQDKELEKCRIREDKHDAEIKALRSENLLLRDMVTSKAEVGQLMDLLATHHRRAETAWANILKTLEEGFRDDV